MNKGISQIVQLFALRIMMFALKKKENLLIIQTAPEKKEGLDDIVILKSGRNFQMSFFEAIKNMLITK